MKKFMRWMMISCRKAGVLIEKKLYGHISPIEKMELAIHTRVCKACRTYEKQSKEMNDAIKDSFNPSENTAPDDLKESLKEKYK